MRLMPKFECQEISFSKSVRTYDSSNPKAERWTSRVKIICPTESCPLNGKSITGKASKSDRAKNDRQAKTIEAIERFCILQQKS